MRNPAYLTRSRHGIFYFRFALPRATHSAQKPTTIKVSLGTRDPKLALAIARRLSYTADCASLHVADTAMRYEDIRAVMTRHFADRLVEVKAQIAATGRLSPLDVDVYRNSAALAQDAIETGLPFNTVSDAPMMQAFLQNYNLLSLDDDASRTVARSELLRAYRDFCEEIIEHDNSLEKYRYAPTDTDSVKPLIDVPIGLRLTDAIAAFTVEKHHSGSWDGKTAEQKKVHWSLIYEVFGDNVYIREMQTSHAKQLKDILLKYPKNRNKDPRTRGLILAAALEVTGIDKIQTLTVNKYLVSYNDLFKWAKDNSHVDANIFQGSALRKNSKKFVETRTPFNGEHIRVIREELVYNSLKLVTKNSLKWASLLGLYTGARLNEIAQLRLEDIKSNDGIAYISITDDDLLQKVKTKASRRKIPVHSYLLKLGFLEYVDTLRRSGEMRLFPDFTYCEKEAWIRVPSRWFNDTFLVKLGIKTPQLVFHSFRHTVNNTLIRAGVEANIILALMGHTPESVNRSVYFSEGYRLQQLSDAVEELDYATRG